MKRIKAFSLDDLKEKMATEDISTLDQIEGAGILPTSNFGGTAILINTTGETVFIQEIWDTGYKEIKEAEIFYSSDGEARFRYNGETYSLNEFMRNNYGRKID